MSKQKETQARHATLKQQQQARREQLDDDRRVRRESSGLFYLSARTGSVMRVGADEHGAIRSSDLGFIWNRPGDSSVRGLGAQKAYQRVAPVFQAIEIRTGALAGVPYTLETKKGVTIFDSDPLKNTELPDEFEFLEALPLLFDLSEAALSLVGKVRILKEHPEATSKLDNLRWFNPLTISVPHDGYEMVGTGSDQRRTGKILKYEKAVEGGKKYDILAKDMIAIDRPDPFVEMGPGTAPLSAALEGAKVLDAVATFISGHVATGLVKNLFFTLKDPTSRGIVPEPDSLLEFKTGIFSWIRNRGKMRRAEDVKVLSEHTEIHEVGEGLKDIHNKELSDNYWRWVAGAFNIPLGLMLENASNYATYMGQLFQLYTFTIFKDCRCIQMAFNKQLLNDMGLRLQFQYRRVEAVQWAEMQKAASAQMLVGGLPILTPDQAIQLFQLWPEKQQAGGLTNGAAPEEEARRLVRMAS